VPYCLVHVRIEFIAFQGSGAQRGLVDACAVGIGSTGCGGARGGGDRWMQVRKGTML